MKSSRNTSLRDRHTKKVLICLFSDLGSVLRSSLSSCLLSKQGSCQSIFLDSLLILKIDVLRGGILRNMKKKIKAGRNWRKNLKIIKSLWSTSMSTRRTVGQHWDSRVQIKVQTQQVRAGPFIWLPSTLRKADSRSSLMHISSVPKHISHCLMLMK